MNRRYRALALAPLVLAAFAVSACDGDDDDYTPPDRNTVVVVNETDECPRADGTPCK